ncbi:MAG: hypothetical protein F4Y86_16430 [Gammaproteobacteria bacterium]|nr:hypothetical protein [Gammaproteobacteria bacterium]MYB35970.1 hypothetical protein [Gammaproteobacteria bacterium]
METKPSQPPTPTDPVIEEARDYYQDLLSPVFRGRKFLHAGGLAVMLASQARGLAAFGAARPFLLAHGRGTGEMPAPEEAELAVLPVHGEDVLDHFRQSEAALRQLPEAVQAAIDDWDPEREARALCGFMLDERGMDVIAGRRRYAHRPAAWTALEDKVRVDAFWDSLGVHRAPSRIVPADHDALKKAARELDRGMGTVWAADARSGLHGGAEGLRWVRSGHDGSEAFEALAAIAYRVRVMPFLEGVPASIHGVVLPDGVAVFRPVELIVLRPDRGQRLLYAGCSNWFDPRPEDREAMRSLARRVGDGLRSSVGYRGAFTIDGVLAEEGFLPTELNARAGAGLGPLTRGLGDFPLTPLCWAAAHGEALDYRASLLERAVLTSADGHRSGGGWIVTPFKLREHGTMELARDGDDFTRRREPDEATASLVSGPHPLGGFLSLRLTDAALPAGSPAAPEMVRALRLADRQLGSAFGPLTAARNARP